MKLRLVLLVNLLLAVSLLAAACGGTTPTPTQPPEATPTQALAATPAPIPEGPEPDEPIYLSIIWHQHQPVYFKDPESGVYAKPWVRVHATKDYVDMAAILKQYPGIRATFNLTPSLLRQIEDLNSGAKDLYWVLAEKPAEQLSQEEKEFILERFFDITRTIISRFPRYQELLVKRDTGNAIDTYTEEDFRDLQVLFNLAWVDPDWLAQEPLAGLVSKGRGFNESDKEILFREHSRLIAEVIPIHKELQDSGQIEVTMTPYAHPILPLLISTDLARVALPDIDLGGVRFTYGADAVAQLELGVELYERHFGQPPRGMWPAEGSVAQEMVGMVSRAGIQWMASDEKVLANSLGFPSFTRNAREVVTEPDQLYRPYYVQSTQGSPVAIVFRDVVISDRVGFIYSGLKGSVAAADFINRIHAIRDALKESGAEGPHLVSVILDGENAWEYYENDGKEFLHSMYEMLSGDPTIKTVTPSEFLAISPDQPKLDRLWAGSWSGADFSTWIGEEEENRAWEYLTRTRELLQKYESGIRQTTPEKLEQAQMMMYIAEGSDWFWWYGDDKDSGNDGAFDQQFRDTLRQVYLALDEEPPSYVDIPIISQQAVSADRPSSGLITPEIDGVISEEEWEAGGVYTASGGVMDQSEPFFEELVYGFDSQNLYLNPIAAWSYAETTGSSVVEVYMNVPGGGATSNFSRNGTLLGFPANRLLIVEFEDGQDVFAGVFTALGEDEWSDPEPLENFASSSNILEIASPLTLLGNPDHGDRITMRAIYSRSIQVAEDSQAADVHQLPGTGPAVLLVPDLGKTVTVLNVDDPERDDHGPGSYIYPSDAVFTSGSYDILNFQAGYDEENIVFKFSLRGKVDNVWNSPNGLSIQTFDIYIDTDGDGQGGRNLLTGRNLVFQDGYAWDYAITVEGWESGIYVPGQGGPEKVAEPAQFTVLADPGQQRVTIRVPKSILVGNLQDWRISAMLLSQDGLPTSGVQRVRDVTPAAQQWRLGGAPAGSTNHTRVVDLVWPEPGQQEAWLNDFNPSSKKQPELEASDFAQIPMMEVQE